VLGAVGAFEVVETVVVVEVDAGRGLQRLLSARFFLATRLWWPRDRAWTEESTERALTGVAPNEQARIARDESAMRFRSLEAIVGGRERRNERCTKRM